MELFRVKYNNDYIIATTGPDTVELGILQLPIDLYLQDNDFNIDSMCETLQCTSTCPLKGKCDNCAATIFDLLKPTLEKDYPELAI